MSTNHIPIKKMYYCGYILEVTAMQINGKWYPLLHILTQGFIQTHPWQLPAVEGAEDSLTAIKTAISIGHEMIRGDTANPGGSDIERLANKSLQEALEGQRRKN